jgi:multidrug efflux system outer membrane protein
MGYCEPGDRGGLTELSGEPPGTMARGAACAPGRAASPVRSAGIALMGSLVFALCGCASGLRAPDPKPADVVTVPPAWSGLDVVPTQAASSLARWWQRFDDPLLSTLVDLSWQANTRVRDAQGALAQARALRDVAAAALWPTLNVSASIQNGTSGGSRTGNRLQVGLGANWTPDVFGVNRSALDATASTVLSRDATMADVMAAIAAEVGLSYIQLRSAQARLGIAADNLASQEETLQITRWRFQAGLVTSLEVEQARGSAEQTRALLPTLQIAIDQTRHALAVLTGQPPEAPSALLAGLRRAGPVPLSTDDPILAVPAETLRLRADVRAAEYEVSAAWSRVAQADAARFPGFSLGGTLGLGGATLGSLTSGASVVSALVASMAAPLFDAGAARARVRAQQAAFEQARIAYVETVLVALREVEDALTALRGDRQRLVSLRNAADAAALAAQLAVQRFSSGLVDFQVVLETQRARLATQDNVATAQATVSADQVRLYRALGGGWSPIALPPAGRSPDQAIRIPNS